MGANLLITEIRKDLKDLESVMLANENPIECERILTQCITLDIALGGGLPLRRICEIFGDEGSGKTTVCLHAIASVQKNGGIGVIIDVEQALDLDYARSIGVDIDNLIFSQPDSGEKALNMVSKLMKTKIKNKQLEPMLIVVDSVAALTPQSLIDGEIGDRHVSALALLMSESLKVLNSLTRKSNTVLLFTNQLRETINTTNRYYKPPPQTTGGKALRFYSSVRIRLTSGKQVTFSDENVGINIRASAIKNKTSPPYKNSNFRIIYGEGIDIPHSLFLACLDKDVIVGKGAWFSIPTLSKYKFQGEENAIGEIKNNEKLFRYLDRKLKEIIVDGN